MWGLVMWGGADDRLRKMQFGVSEYFFTLMATVSEPETISRTDSGIEVTGQPDKVQGRQIRN